MDILGIDVGKREMHAVLLQQDRSSSKTVPNSAAGFQQLRTWLRNRKVGRLHACLEATGGWSEDIALSLHDSRIAKCCGQKPIVSTPRSLRVFAACTRRSHGHPQRRKSVYYKA
jgi:transposase